MISYGIVRVGTKRRIKITDDESTYVKIALLADIHGNASALERALDAVSAQNPDKIAVLGDMIGYYYDASVIVDLVRSHADIVVRGNHERMYADIISGLDDGGTYRSRYGQSLDIAAHTLSDDQNEWILTLPDRATIELCGQSIEFSHEVPTANKGYLYPDANERAINAAVPQSADVFCFGHTHYPFSVVHGRCLLINPGSIGQARDVGGLAQWAILHVETRAVEIKHTPYNTAPVYEAARQYDPDIPYLQEVLRRGKLE